MATRAREGELQRLGLQLLEPGTPAQQQELLLDVLLKVVPGEVAGEIKVDRLLGRAVVAERPQVLPAVPSASPAMAAGNPGLARIAAHGQLPATRVTDFWGLEAWRRHPLCRDLLAPAGIPYALLCGYSPRPGVLHGWGINRERDFSDAEQDRLEALQPFLRLAAAARYQAQLVEEFSQVLAAGAGLLVTDGRRLLHSNPEGERLWEAHHLPSDLLMRLVALALRRAGKDTIVRTDRGLLRLRLRPGGNLMQMLVLDEPPNPMASAQAAGVTARQRAVLLALSEGLTAHAIGHRLGISPRTVHKHLEETYRRLGAHDRLDAIRRAARLGILEEHAVCYDATSQAWAGKKGVAKAKPPPT